MPQDAWSVCDGNIDLPLCEILERNVALRRQIGGLTVSAGRSIGVGFVLQFIRSGEVLFIATNSFSPAAARVIGCVSVLEIVALYKFTELERTAGAVS